MKTNRRYAKATAYLERLRKAENHVKGLETRAESLRMMATDTSNHMSGISGRGGGDRDRTGRMMAEIDEIERQLETARDEARKTREEIGMKLCQISDPIAMKAIVLHDIEHLSGEETAEIMRCSRTQIYRLRDAGYAELEKIL